MFFILLVFFINGFSESYNSHNITNLAYVLALGIDVGEKSALKVTAQFSKTAIFSSSSGSSSDDNSQIVLVSGEANSIFSAINLINSYIGKEINLSQCSLIVFSEDFAKKGISSQIYSLVNNEEIRPSNNIIVSKCNAYEYLSTIKPNLEKLTVHYYDTFSLTNKFTGYFSNITLSNLYNHLTCKNCSSTAILGGLDVSARENENSKDITTNPENLVAGSSSIEGKRGTENIGIAVFKNDKYCGELTATETICHLLIQNEIDDCIISVDNPFIEGKKTELNVYPTKKTKIDVKIVDDIPYITVQVFAEADILTVDESINYTLNENLEKFSEASQNYLKQNFEKYFEKISKEYSTDIDSFSHKALSNFSTTTEWNEFNWKDKFSNSKFNISVNINVLSSLLITKS